MVALEGPGKIPGDQGRQAATERSKPALPGAPHGALAGDPTEALRFLGGVTTRVMIDNTHVVVLRGSGRDMVPVPEMAAFGERFGFQFVAHAIGNANRSGRVERPFHFIENNFLAGRTFRSWEDLNQRSP